MEQAKALNALEPFLALSKSATSPRAAADLITRATSAPNTFVFTELLQTPQIQALASSDAAEFGPYLTILQIFSYGTYSTYSSSTAPLPELTDAQKLKLRQLSLLTLASDKSNALTYSSLLQQLELATPRELEELVIGAVYAGLINAQLDPKNEVVQINSVAALRDVAPGAIGGLLSSLQSWAGRCEATLHSLEAQMSGLRADADKRAAETAAWTNKMESLVENEQKGGLGPSSFHRDQYPNHRHDHYLNQSQNSHQFRNQQGGMMSSSSLLTGRGGSFSGLAAGESASSATLPAAYATGGIMAPVGGLMMAHQRYGKRGSGQMDGSESGELDETMDLDDFEDEDDGKKRASRRKL